MVTDRTFRVGVDVGGTFTDIVCLSRDGRLRTRKVPSTADDYSRAIRAGLQELLSEMGIDGASVGELIHGATIAGNAILEHTGALTGLITTTGFRDVLEIRRLRMPRLYDMEWEKPKPLVERYRRLEVGERINFRGEVLRALDPAEACVVIDRLLERGAESIAVCLINAYANPAHEQLIEVEHHYLQSLSLREHRRQDKVSEPTRSGIAIPFPGGRGGLILVPMPIKGEGIFDQQERNHGDVP